MISGNGLLPTWCQAITWTNAALLSASPLGINPNEIKIKPRNLFQENLLENVLQNSSYLV